MSLPLQGRCGPLPIGERAPPGWARPGVAGRLGAALVVALLFACSAGPPRAARVRALLLDTARRFPAARVDDYYRLLHEAVFGPRPVRYPRGVWLNLEREWRRAGPPGTAEEICHTLSPAVARVNLRALKARGGTPQEVLRAHLYLAHHRPGTKGALRPALRVLAKLADEGRLPIDGVALRRRVTEMEKLGYPLVRHSDAFRARYAPSYRLVSPGRFPACQGASPPSQVGARRGPAGKRAPSG